MPILEREVDLYPDDLLERHECSSADEENWWVLYTRSRREKALMRKLHARNIPFYGPVIPKRYRSNSGRVRTSYIPLFPNYVFVLGDVSTRREILTTNCISRCFEVSDSESFINDLKSIRRLVNSGIPLTIESQLASGDRVCVKSGPLKGQDGVILERRGERRLLVSVNIIQQGASLLLEDFEVERIS